MIRKITDEHNTQLQSRSLGDINMMEFDPLRNVAQWVDWVPVDVVSKTILTAEVAAIRVRAALG